MRKKGVMVRVTRGSRTISTIHHDLQTRLVAAVLESEEKLTDQDQRARHGAHVSILYKARDEEEVDRCLLEVNEEFGNLGRSREKPGTVLWFQF